jgi:hypothetical protein
LTVDFQGYTETALASAVRGEGPVHLERGAGLVGLTLPVVAKLLPLQEEDGDKQQDAYRHKSTDGEIE